MDNNGFREWIDRHRLTDKLAARFLKIDKKTVQRYREGDLLVPQPVSTACSALDPVQLWRLEPLDLFHIDWRASSYKGVAIVRAQGETLARWHAAIAFNVPVRRRSDDEPTPINPWSNPDQVIAAVTRPGPGMTVAGSPGIVLPAAEFVGDVARQPARTLLSARHSDIESVRS